MPWFWWPGQTLPRLMSFPIVCTYTRNSHWQGHDPCSTSKIDTVCLTWRDQTHWSSGSPPPRSQTHRMMAISLSFTNSTRSSPAHLVQELEPNLDCSESDWPSAHHRITIFTPTHTDITTNRLTHPLLHPSSEMIIQPSSSTLQHTNYYLSCHLIHASAHHSHHLTS